MHRPDPRIQDERTLMIASGTDSDSLAWCKFARRPNGVLWLCALWVHPDHRKQGYAKALIETALWEYGDERIYLEAVPYTDRPMDTTQLIAFYETFGFRKTSVPGILVREPPE